MRIVLRRFIEFTGAEILLSVMAVALNLFEIIISRYPVALMLIISIILYLVLNIFQLRFCYEDAPDVKEYYVFNFLAYGMFLAVTVLSYLFMPNSVHTWLFSLIKALCYLGHSAWLSMLIFFGTLAVVIVAAPMGVYWVEVDDEEDMNRLSEYGKERTVHIDHEKDMSYDEDIEPGYLGDEDEWKGISVWKD